MQIVMVGSQTIFLMMVMVGSQTIFLKLEVVNMVSCSTMVIGEGWKFGGPIGLKLS